jgi:hypothetical protein
VIAGDVHFYSRKAVWERSHRLKALDDSHISGRP